MPTLRSWSNPPVIFLALLVLPATLSATIWINNSTFGATSTGVMVFRSGDADFIDWCPTNTGSPPTGAPACGVRNDATGELLVQPGSGNFLTLAPNTPGLILDITDVSGATGPAPGASYTLFPPGVPVNINTFIRISSHPEWNFVAGLLVVPTCSGSDVCIGPFHMSQTDTPNGPFTSVSIAVTGTVTDSAENTSANFRTVVVGRYPLAIAQVVALMQSPAGAFSNTISSTTTVTLAP